MALIQHHGPIASSTELGVSWKEVFFKTLSTSTYNRLQIMRHPCMLTLDPAVLHVGVYSVFGGLVTQLCSISNVCVKRGHTLCAYINSLSVFTPLGTAVLSSLYSDAVVLL